MAGEATITIVGNVGGDPDLRFTNSGDAVASFSVGVTPRKKQGNDWVDMDTTWYRVSAWRWDAEGVAEHVRKGDKVKVTGRLAAGTYEAKDGSTRVSLDVTADMDGVSIIPKPAKRVERDSFPDSGGGDPWS